MPDVKQENTPGMSPELYTAVYSGIQVFEMMANDVAVMRRRTDSSLNATQILKVAGVEKSKRTKILEKEILTGAHEKVQGGYGKYQGTWIPYERGVDLCRQYSVYDVLQPLLAFDPAQVGDYTPTKEQAMAARRKRIVATKQQSRMDMPLAQPLQLPQTHTPLSVSAERALSMLGNSSMASLGNTSMGSMASPNVSSLTPQLGASTPGTDSASPPAKRFKAESNGHSWPNSQGPGAPHVQQQQQQAHPALEFDENLPTADLFSPTNLPMDPLPPDAHNDASRDIMTQLFMGHGATSFAPGINVDVPIDDMGHAALHWAAALARVDVVRALVMHGADRRRANYAGETSLVRAILVTNNFDSGTFPQMLDIIYPAIPLLDKQNRTLLHHIALTAGIRGRAAAAKYYLECLLEWIVRRGTSPKRIRFSLARFMQEIVNAQDKYGDTALNIAARVGNRAIVTQLIEVGADPMIPNRAGLRPVDFGVTINLAEVKPMLSRSGERVGFSANAETRSKDILQTIISSIEGLDTDFSAEMAGRSRAAEQAHAELRGATNALSEARQRLENLKNLSSKRDAMLKRAMNLERALHDEDAKFQAGSNGADVSFEGNFDADQPFRTRQLFQAPRDKEWSVQEMSAVEVPSQQVLQARVRAYRKNQAELEQTSGELRGRSTELEHKFRRVIALSTGVAEDKVDELLEGLVQAVESDSGEVDINRVAGFLRKLEPPQQA
ncbi:Start control protein [Yarrowia sp. B02]|nr:Start control protein [Yarrowia sp. B02]